MVNGETTYCHSDNNCSDSDCEDGLTYRCVFNNHRSLGTCQCVGKQTHTHTNAHTHTHTHYVLQYRKYLTNSFALVMQKLLFHHAWISFKLMQLTSIVYVNWIVSECFVNSDCSSCHHHLHEYCSGHQHTCHCYGNKTSFICYILNDRWWSLMKNT